MTQTPQKLYHCGKLTYTRMQLCTLFFWLMLAVACLGLANSAPTAILPIQLKELGVSDTASWLILSCILSVMNMTVCPYISVASDLHRSRWGRRIPFIFLSMPPIVLSLVLFGFTLRFGDALSAWAQPLWHASPATMTALVMGLVMILYQFFAMWANSVIWYIFIDIIPPEFFGRIMACVRLALQFGAAFFHYFLFPHAQKHSTAIFLGLAAVYGVGITLFCLNVKEDEYPPLTEEQLARKHAKGLDRLKAKVWGLKDFVKLTFCHRVYWLRYLIFVSGSLSGAAGVFNYFLVSKQLKLTDADYGHMNGISGMVLAGGIFVAALLPALVNRWHPTRIMVYHYIFTSIAGLPFLLRWMFGTMPPQVLVNLSIVSSIINLLISGLYAICDQPLEMMLFPKSRYGTFCAMQAMLRSWTSLLAGFLVARLFDYAAAHFSNTAFALQYGDGWHYRLSQPWAIPWLFLTATAAYLLYREWNRLGGYHAYASPTPWTKEGHEHVDPLPCQPVNPDSMKRCLPLFDAFFLFFAVLPPAFALWNCLGRIHAPLVLPDNPATHTISNAVRDFFLAGGEPTLLREYMTLPTILGVAALVLWLPLRTNILARANHSQNGGGLLQPALLLVYMVSHALDQLNCVWGILHTPGPYGATLMTLTSTSTLCVLAVIATIHFMERGISVTSPPEFHPSTAPMS